jgi:hypothetical protein
MSESPPVEKELGSPANDPLKSLDNLHTKLSGQNLQGVTDVLAKTTFSKADYVNIFTFIAFTIVALNLDLDHNSFIVYKLVLYFVLASRYVLLQKTSAENSTMTFLGIFAYQFLSSSIAFYYLIPISSAKRCGEAGFHIQAETNDIAVNSIAISITYSFFKYPQQFVDESKKFYMASAVFKLLLVELTLPSFSFKLVVYYAFYLLILWAQFYFVSHRLQQERELLQTSWSKASANLKEEVVKIRKEIETSYRNISPFTSSDADKVMMKLKFMKFELMAGEKSTRKTPSSRSTTKKLSMVSDSGQHIHKSYRKSNFSSAAEQAEEDAQVKTPSNKVSDWKMNTRDVDIILDGLLSKQSGIWIPDIAGAARQKGLSQEATEFVLQHFTENLQNFKTETSEYEDVMLDPKLLEINPLNTFLETNIGNWNFDMFKLKDLATETHMIDFGYSLFKKFNMHSVLACDAATIQSFLQAVQFGYKKNPYHNALHGADCANAIAFMVTNGLENYLNQFDLTCMLISALVHDLGHPGLNNPFLISTKSSEALIYNDMSVLENLHAASFFKVLNFDQTNILKNLHEKDYKAFRKLSITLILDTDLQKHFVLLNKFKNMVALKQYNMKEDADKQFIMSIALKCADIAHGSKELGLHKKWSRRIIEEFYIQGDKEAAAKLPVTPMCDRKGNISKSQEGFLKVICLPLFDAFDEFLINENVCENIRNTCSPQIKRNMKYWEEEQKVENEGKSTFLTETDKIKAEISAEMGL